MSPRRSRSHCITALESIDHTDRAGMMGKIHSSVNSQEICLRIPDILWFLLQTNMFAHVHDHTCTHMYVKKWQDIFVFFSSRTSFGERVFYGLKCTDYNNIFFYSFLLDQNFSDTLFKYWFLKMYLTRYYWHNKLKTTYDFTVVWAGLIWCRTFLSAK